jgi:group I intron endonuclease
MIIKENEIYIYKILNKIDNKFYIGSTCNIKKRWKQHINSLHQGKHHSIYLQRAWDKYGEINFIFSIIGSCSKKEAKEYEQYFLDTYKSYDYNIGYNMNHKVDSRKGRPMSKEAIEKYKIKRKNQIPTNKGRVFSEEWIWNLSKSHIGQKSWNKGKKMNYSKETRWNMGKGHRGCTAWGNGIKGKSVTWNKGLTKETDERIAKMANSKEINLKKSIIVKEWWRQKKLKQKENAA